MLKVEATVLTGVLALSALIVGAATPQGVDAATICQAKNGILKVRAAACKTKETVFDLVSLIEASGTVTQLSGQVSGLTTQVNQQATLETQLSTQLAGKQDAGAKGTVAAYATVNSNGTLVQKYTKQIGANVTSTRNQLGQYTLNFGFQLQPGQPILLSTRETFGHEICRVFQGTNPTNTVSVFCVDADVSSPAADVGFTVVVLN